MRWFSCALVSAIVLAVFVSPIFAAIAANGSISGFVLLQNGSVAASANVSAFNFALNSNNFTSSGADGAYTLSNLQYDDSNGTNLYDMRAAFAGMPDVFTLPPAAPVNLNGTTYNRTDINFTFVSNASIFGIVKYQNGSPVPNAVVSLNRSGFSRNVTANGAGAYNMTGIVLNATGTTNYSLRALDIATGNTSNTILMPLTGSAGAVPQNITINISSGQQGGENGMNGTVSGFVNGPYGGAVMPNNVLVTIMNGTFNRSMIVGNDSTYLFSNLTWPNIYQLYGRGTGSNKVASPYYALNMTSGNYNITQEINLSDEMMGGGECRGNFTMNGQLRNLTVNITNISMMVELKVRNATCGPYDMACFYKANQSNYTTGRFSIGCLEAGNYSLFAMPMGGGPNQTGPMLMLPSPLNISITDENITDLLINLSTDSRGPQGCNGQARIYGYVMDAATGNAISNVNVFAGVAASGNGSGGQNFCGGGALTTTNGSYSISGLLAGSYMLNAMPPTGSGYGEVHLGPQQAIQLANNNSSYQYDFNLSGVGYVIGTVQVNISGSLSTVPGAGISIYSQTSGGAYGYGTTNGLGVFNISMAPGTAYMLNVNPPTGSGYSSYATSGITVATSATTDAGTITLRQGGTVSGYVLNASGGGIANVGVNAHPIMMNSQGSGGMGYFTMTNGSGYYALSGLQTNVSYAIEVFPDPSTSYSNGHVEFFFSGQATAINVTLTSGNAVQGYVRCNGTGVQYSPINFFKYETGMNGPMMSGNTMQPGTYAFTMTNGSGYYVARGLLPGNYTMRAETPFNTNINCSANMSTAEITAGTNNLNVSLPLAATLSGRVNSSGGANVSYAFINAFVPSSNGGPGMGGPSANAMTDANGLYSMKIAPSGSEYVIEVHPQGGDYASAERRINLTTAGTQYSLNFTLSSGGSVRGKVVDGSGNAVRFAMVNIFSENARSFGFANTMSDGSFQVFGLLTASDYRVFIQPPSSTGGITPTFITGVSVASGQATDLGTITATSSNSHLLVSVTDAGNSIYGAKVQAWMPGMPFFGYCTTNASGQCNMTGLAAGTYNLAINAPDRPQAFNDSVAVASGANSYGFDYNTSFGTMYSVSGNVTNGTDGAVAYADVGIWNEVNHFGMHTAAGSDGAFVFASVPAGTYKIGAMKPGYYNQVAAITVSGNAVQPLIITPVSAGSSYKVDGYLASQSGSSVAGKTVAVVDALNATRFSAFNVTDGGGFYEISGVPPAQYKVFAAMGNVTYGVNVTVASANVTANITVS